MSDFPPIVGEFDVSESCTTDYYNDPKILFYAAHYCLRSIVAKVLRETKRIEIRICDFGYGSLMGKLQTLITLFSVLANNTKRNMLT